MHNYVLNVMCCIKLIVFSKLGVGQSSTWEFSITRDAMIMPVCTILLKRLRYSNRAVSNSSEESLLKYSSYIKGN